MDQLSEWLRKQVADLMDVSVETVDPRIRFRELGMDSGKVGALMTRLTAHLGRAVPLTLPWECPTIEQASRRLTVLLQQNAGTMLGGHLPPGSRDHEPAPVGDGAVAIVGVGCRFPGGADSPDRFWKLLREGVDAIREVPPERWDVERYFDPHPDVPGKMVSRWGGFLEEVDRFDPTFFSISPREAVEMDPQQRLFLMTVWECLEDAGIPPSTLHGSRTGVFVGAMGSDYASLGGDDTCKIGLHTAVGEDTSIIPARVSYLLGLQGPCLTLNTACSSSLVAVHLAVESLRRGETTLALAGGVNLILSPHTSVAMSKLGTLSPDGRCKAFDARANGYVRSEGCGVVVLKPLERALEDGDRIYALIRGSAVNNDGFSNGLTAPNPEAQVAVYRDAWARADVDPSLVGYVEAHGPGTFLGDPIEANSLGQVFGMARGPGKRLQVGSVKMNLGHLEAAAGIAGLVKVALALHHGGLPPSLHFQIPNPNIDFQGLGLEVRAASSAWPEAIGGRYAGVSAFGFGGTNCHVALEQAPRGRCFLLPLRGGSVENVVERAARLLPLIGNLEDDEAVRARCLASGLSPAPDTYRLALLGQGPGELADRLYDVVRRRTVAEQIPASRPTASRLAASRPAATRPRIAFLFPGHGTQWAGMGRTLLHCEPVFAAELRACDRHIRELTGWSVVEVLVAPPSASLLEQTHVVQPVIFSVQAGLGALWRAWGVVPDAVMGHSLGEIAAAYFAGILTREDACRIVCARGEYTARLPAGKGGMAVVALAVSELEPILAPLGGQVSVAAWNTPESTVISGDRQALESVLARLDSNGIRAAWVPIRYASHSHQLDPLLEPFELSLEGIAAHPARTPMWSTADGTWLEGTECGPGYWRRNLRSPVRFAQGVQTTLKEGISVFVEVSPHPVLLEPTRKNAEQLGAGVSAVVLLPSCSRDTNERDRLLETLGQLYTLGAQVFWPEVYRGTSPTICGETQPLPPEQPAEAPGIKGARAVLVPLSANSRQALSQQAQRLRLFLSEHPGYLLPDVAYSASCRRNHFACRLAMVAESMDGLSEALEAASAGVPHPAVVLDEGRARGKTVFVFPGQGSQWEGMGQALKEAEPVFARTLEACETALRPFTGWSLLDVLLGTGDGGLSLERVDVVQPALFATSVAIAALWRSWGFEPDAVVGHSQGEVAAAYVAGALSLEDAARIVACRSQIVRRVSGRGAMALVELSADEVIRQLHGLEDHLVVAANNSERATVISGSPEVLDEWLARQEAAGVFCRRIQVDIASHSPQMEPLRADLLRALEPVRPKRGIIPLCSTVTGEMLDGSSLDAQYWVENLCRPVRFETAVKQLLGSGHRFFVEASPHPVLTADIRTGIAAEKTDGVAVHSLKREDGGRARMLLSLGELYVGGFPVDWSRQHPGGGRLVSLPAHPFRLERYWRERAPAVPDAGHAEASDGESPGHPLLGRPLELSVSTPHRFWTPLLSAETVAYLSDHRVGEAVVFPGAGVVEMALAAARQVLEQSALVVEDLLLHEPLVLHDRITPAVQFVMTGDSGAFRFQLLRRVAGDSGNVGAWSAIAEGRVRPALEVEQTDGDSRESEIRVRCSKLLSEGEIYTRLGLSDLNYGPAFRSLEQIQVGQDEAWARVRLPEEAGSVEPYAVHPVLLDACLQAAVVAGLSGKDRPTGPVLPVSVGKLVVRGEPGRTMGCHVQVSPRGEGKEGMIGRAVLYDSAGAAVLVMEDVAYRLVPEDNFREDRSESLLYSVCWRKQDTLPAPAPGRVGRWLLLADRQGLAERLEALLSSSGRTVIRVEARNRNPQVVQVGTPHDALVRVAHRAGQDARAGRDAGDLEADATGANASAGEYVIDPMDPEAFERLLGQVLADDRPLEGVLYLWGLETPGPEGTPHQAGNEGTDEGCAVPCTMGESLSEEHAWTWAGALHLARALARQLVRDLPRVVLVGNGCQAEGLERPVSPGQALLWGLGGSIQAEHPEWRGIRVDISDPASPDEASALLREMVTDGVEDQVLLRGNARYSARLVRRPRASRTGADRQAGEGGLAGPSDNPVRFRSDGTYLITGGYGGLGSSVANWMARNGAGHLLLLSRRGADTPERQAIVETIRASGARVTAVAADVADVVGLERVLGTYVSPSHPLRGIVHAAGILEDALLEQQDIEKFRAVLRPKVAGAWALHRLSFGQPLDFFALYSSVAAVLGMPGQSNYSAANSFLDALSYYRRALGLPALSVNWGPFADAGLAAARDDRASRLSTRGIRSLSTELGVEVLGRLLGETDPRVCVARLDVRQWVEFYPAAAVSPYLSELLRGAARGDGGGRGDEAALASVRMAPRPQRARIVERYLVDLVSAVLRTPADHIDREKPLRELGLDSLLGLELRNRVEATFGLRLPAAVIWTYPTVAKLAAHLPGLLEAASPTAEAVGEDVPDGFVSTGRLKTEMATPAMRGEPAPGAAVSGKGRTSALEARLSEPIAIVGMGCRFPGGGDSPTLFWKALERGVDGVCCLEGTRWPAETLAGQNVPRWAAFLDRIDGFDAAFFGIPPREAISLDPQQRLLLEVSWEALEDAGLPPSGLAGSRTGVYVGIMNHDYNLRLAAAGGREPDMYGLTGTGNSFAAGRLSYVLGLEGPSMVVDTACSSSLVALHLACESLRSGHSDLALSGGVNLILSPTNMLMIAKTQTLSPDGRCKTFDARANGFVRGEGCGMLILERLSDAQRKGHRILACIRGSWVNHDGRSAGLTAPNVLAQETLLRETLRQARVRPGEVTCIEAHGTGTSLGDPIELEALTAVYGAPGEGASPCFLGSVKANIGHLESAAGVAGVIKTVLALGQGRIPKQANFQTLNPRISLEATRFAIPTENRDWPTTAGRRLAGVSSFGLSGTNAHVILEEAPLSAASGESAGTARALPGLLRVVPISAKSAKALEEQVARLHDHLQAEPDLDLVDVVFTLATARTHFPYRLGVVVSSREGLLEALAGRREGKETTRCVRGVPARGARDTRGDTKAAFLFTGQGVQYAGMGKVLYETYPAFRNALDTCATLLGFWLDRPLLAVLFADEDSPDAALLERALWAQPALFSFEYALDFLLASWGIRPDLVMGHGVGELAAACVAGVFSLEDGLKLAAARGRFFETLPAGSTMVPVQAPETAVTEKLVPFRQIASGIRYRAPELPLVSNVTGQLATDEVATAEYWVGHVRAPVLFARGVETLVRQGATTWLEVGPQPTLLAMAAACHPAGPASGGLACLRKGKDAQSTLLRAVGQWFVAGRELNWEVFLAPFGGRRVSLPTYPFQRERFWIDAPVTTGSGLLEAPSAPSEEGATSAGSAVRVTQPLPPSTAPERGGICAPEECFYRLEWRAIKLEETLADPGPDLCGAWVLCSSGSPPEGIGKLAERLREAGARVVVCEGAVGLDAALSKLAEEGRRVAGVVGFWLGDSEDEAGTAETIGLEGLEWLQVLLKRLHPTEAQPPTRAWWVTFGAQAVSSFERPVLSAALLWGLGRVWLREHPEWDVTLVDLEPKASAGGLEAFSRLLGTKTREPQVAVRDGRFLGARLVRADKARQAFLTVPENDPYRLVVRQPGLLDTLALEPVARRSPGPDEVEIRILASGLNFRDVLTTLGMYPGEGGPLGQECAGVVSAVGEAVTRFVVGDAVMALAPASFSRFVTVDARLVARQPSGLTAEQAAAIPVAFLTAWYALRDLGALKAGERILVHSAAGGVGMAAVQLARWWGAEVYGTASPGKWAALRSAGIRHMASSRTLEFADRFLEESGGEGMDLVLNSLTCAFIDSSLSLLRPGGRFLEMGKTDIRSPQEVATAHPGVRFRVFDLLEAGAERVGAILAELVEAFEGGALEPLPVRVFPIAEAESAFRFMAQARHTGKLVLTPAVASMGTRTALRPGSSVLITGGMGALGLEVARWVATELRAAHLVLVGRSAPDDASLKVVEELRAIGTAVTIALADVSDGGAMAGVLTAIPDRCPLRGIFHAAGVVHDGVLVEQTGEQFSNVLAPKVRGAWNLHTLTLEADLDFFVLFSSAASLLGSPGQGNYAAANAFLDGLAWYRRALGLVAQTLNWGPWGGCGMVSRLSDAGRARLRRQGLETLEAAEGVALLEAALSRSEPQLGVLRLDLPAVRETLPEKVASTLLGELEAGSSPDSDQPDSSESGCSERVVRPEPSAGEERASSLVGILQAEVAKILAVDTTSEVPADIPLEELWMDSLLTAELAMFVSALVKKPVSPTLVKECSTIENLAEHLAGILSSPGRTDRTRDHN